MSHPKTGRWTEDRDWLQKRRWHGADASWKVHFENGRIDWKPLEAIE